MRRFTLLLVAVCVCSRVPAQSYEGQVETGFATTPTSRSNTWEPYWRALVDFDTPRKHGAQAHFEVFTDADSRDVDVREAYARLNFNEDRADTPDGTWELSLGYGKKAIGWEYEDSDRHLLTTHRSHVYAFLEEATVVGRDYFAALARAPWRASLHWNDFGDMGIIAEAIFEISEEWSWGGWLSAGRTYDKIWSLTAASGPRYSYGQHRAEAEFFLGQDPVQSATARAFDGREHVSFGAFKVQYGYAIGSWMPYVQGGWIAPDLKHAGRNDFQILAGAKWTHPSDFSVAFEANTLAQKTLYADQAARDVSTSYRVEARYLF